MAVQVGIRKQNAAEVITKVVEGPTGPQGPIGFTGPQGPPGIQGPAGSSNSKWYIGSGAPNLGIGIDNNNDLYLDIDTYDAWFRPTTSWELIGNFKGATGPQGPQGLQGIQGIQGETGQQGIQGLKGDTGDTGPQGTQGIPGIKGDTGDTGPQGLQGIQGIQGEMGPQGPAGDDGVDAPTSFETVSKNLKGYPYTLSYSSGVLSAMVYTTESGIITKSFTYSLGILTSITLSGDTTQDLGNGNGAKAYKGTITLSNSCTLQEAYQYLQYLTRQDSAATLNGTPGWRYRVLNGAYTEIPSAPFGTFAGGTFFVAQGWWLTGVLPAEATKYQLIAHDGTTQVPPTLIGISIGNLVSGDRVLVTRDDGTGAILKDEYTPNNTSSGQTAITVSEVIKTDTPSSGVIRIKGKRYTYSSWSTSTFSGLSPALVEDIVTADDVFVPFIDKQTSSTSESVTFIYASTFTARVDVRQGAGGSPILPFNTSLSVTNAGGSVNASRISDV